MSNLIFYLWLEAVIGLDKCRTAIRMSHEDDFALAYFVNSLVKLSRSHLHFFFSEFLNLIHILEISDVDFVMLHSTYLVIESCKAHKN